MKKNKKSLLDTLKTILKKQTKIEKEKRSKKKTQKKNRPRGFTAKRIGAVSFWILFSFMFLVIAITMFGGSSSGSSSKEKVTIPKVSSHEAIEFTKGFIFELFNSTEDSEVRKNNIKKYVPSRISIDEVLSFDKRVVIETKKEDIILSDLTQVTESDDEKARHVYSVKLNTKTQMSEREKQEYEEMKEKYLEILKQEDSSVIDVKNNQIIRQVDLHIVVPIAYSENRFVVYDYPSYTFIDESENQSVETIMDLLESQNEPAVKENVSAFLDVFFKSFAADSVDQLSYILNDDYYKNGLGNSLTFNSVKDFSLYKGKDDDLVVDVTVTFTQDKTGFVVTSKYILVIAQKEQRYVVNHINNDEYLYDLVYGEETEEEGNGENNTSESEPDESVEGTFNQLKKSVQEAELNDLQSALSVDTLNGIEEMVQYNFGKSDEPLTDEELENMLQEYKKSTPEIEGANSDVYKKLEEPMDMGIMFLLVQFAPVFNEDSGELTIFDSYELVEKDKEVILTYSNEEENIHVSFTFILDGNRNYKLNDYQIKGLHTINDEAEFIPADGIEVIEEKDNSEEDTKDKDNKTDDNKEDKTKV